MKTHPSPLEEEETSGLRQALKKFTLEILLGHVFELIAYSHIKQFEFSQI